MTVEERLAKIDRKVANDRESFRQELARKNAEAEQLFTDVVCCQQRVGDLIRVANYCVEKGIAIPGTMVGISTPTSYLAKRFGWGNGNYGFYADGVYHHLGFDGPPHMGRKIRALCIRAGGACGSWDFYVGERDVFRQNEDRHTDAVQYDIHLMINEMKQFLKEFDQFESAFYAWVDSLS